MYPHGKEIFWQPFTTLQNFTSPWRLWKSAPSGGLPIFYFSISKSDVLVSFHPGILSLPFLWGSWSKTSRPEMHWNRSTLVFIPSLYLCTASPSSPLKELSAEIYLIFSHISHSNSLKASDSIQERPWGCFSPVLCCWVSLSVLILEQMWVQIFVSTSTGTELKSLM